MPDAYNGGMSPHFKVVDGENSLLTYSRHWCKPGSQTGIWRASSSMSFVVSKLDLHELKMPYSGVGSEAFHPEMHTKGEAPLLWANSEKNQNPGRKSTDEALRQVFNLLQKTSHGT